MNVPQFLIFKITNYEEFQVMPSHIQLMTFSRDNQSLFISDYNGHIKIIKWQACANSEDDFDFTEEPKGMGNDDI